MSHFQSAVASLDNSVESGATQSAYDTESLPSYTLVSGLPSYDDALDCYRKAQVSSTARPSIMKLFSFDNPLLGAHLKETSAQTQGELLQVVVGEQKDGLPSYQESLVVVVDEKKRTQTKRTVHRPVLPLKAKQLPVVDDGHSGDSTPTAEEEGSSLMGKLQFLGTKTKRGEELARIHKSPSMVLVYDDEYWRNVHQNQTQGRLEGSLTHSGSSNSLPRNFSAHLLSEA